MTATPNKDIIILTHIRVGFLTQIAFELSINNTTQQALVCFLPSTLFVTPVLVVSGGGLFILTAEEARALSGTTP